MVSPLQKRRAVQGVVEAGRFDVERLDVVLGQPALQGAGDKLAAVVAAEVTRRASLGHQLFHDLDEVGSGKLAGDVEGQALPAVLVDDREDAQLAAVVGAITHEVPAPDVVDPLCPRWDRASGATPSSGSFDPSLDPQVALPPDALDELAPGLPAFLA